MCLSAGLPLEASRDLRGRLGQVALLPVIVRQALEQRDRVAVSGAVLQTHDREPADRLVIVGGRQTVERRPHRIDRARRVPGQQLEGDQRRAAARRALVVEPACEQLDLLPEPELADRTVGDRPLAVVGAPRRRLDLVLPLPPVIRESSLVPRLGERIGLGGCLLKGQDGAALSERGAGPT